MSSAAFCSEQLDGGAAAWAVVAPEEQDVKSSSKIIPQQGQVVGCPVADVVGIAEDTHVAYWAGGPPGYKHIYRAGNGQHRNAANAGLD